jgi:hypothetical protein
LKTALKLVERNPVTLGIQVSPAGSGNCILRKQTRIRDAAGISMSLVIVREGMVWGKSVSSGSIPNPYVFEAMLSTAY